MSSSYASSWFRVLGLTDVAAEAWAEDYAKEQVIAVVPEPPPVGLWAHAVSKWLGRTNESARDESSRLAAFIFNRLLKVLVAYQLVVDDHHTYASFKEALRVGDFDAAEQPITHQRHLSDVLRVNGFTWYRADQFVKRIFSMSAEIATTSDRPSDAADCIRPRTALFFAVYDEVAISDRLSSGYQGITDENQLRNTVRNRCVDARIHHRLAGTALPTYDDALVSPEYVLLCNLRRAELIVEYLSSAGVEHVDVNTGIHYPDTKAANALGRAIKNVDDLAAQLDVIRARMQKDDVSK